MRGGELPLQGPPYSRMTTLRRHCRGQLPIPHATHTPGSTWRENSTPCRRSVASASSKSSTSRAMWPPRRMNQASGSLVYCSCRAVRLEDQTGRSRTQAGQGSMQAGQSRVPLLYSIYTRRGIAGVLVQLSCASAEHLNQPLPAHLPVVEAAGHSCVGLYDMEHEAQPLQPVACGQEGADTYWRSEQNSCSAPLMQAGCQAGGWEQAGGQLGGQAARPGKPMFGRAIFRKPSTLV
jgi:hypothetical protein